MEKYISISEAAKRYGISKRALRYYEEVGLLSCGRWEASNYRCYSEAQLMQLEKILLVKNLGFTLAQARQMMGSGDRLLARSLLSDKLKELKAEIDALNSLKSVIETLVKISEDEGSVGFSVQRLLREHPYLNTTVERRINMNSNKTDKYIIECGFALIPYSNDLVEGIKVMRSQLEAAMGSQLPLVRLKDNLALSEGTYRILIDGKEAVTADLGNIPGKGATDEILESFRTVVLKYQKKQMIKSISVCGLGYIGLPTAVTLALAGFDVKGFDVNPEVIASLKEGKVHISEPGLQEAFDTAVINGRLTFGTSLEKADAYYICVPTPFLKVGNGKRKADLKYVKAAAGMVAEILEKSNLVILESTVPPGTTGNVADIMSAKSGLSRDAFYTAHCPERVIPGRMLEELRNNDRIVGVDTPEAARLVKSIYERVLIEGRVRLTDQITAEMCKLFENTYRDVNIALANELSIISDKLGIDAFELISLANCHPRVNIMTPGVGVGGHCIAVDPWFIHEKCEDEAQLIYTARMRNDSKPGWVAGRVEKLLNGDKNKVIGVFGLTYKADVDDLRESPSIELADILKDKGFRVIACEPNVAVIHVNGMENKPLEQAVKESDFIIITQAHTVFKKNIGLLRAKPFYNCVGIMGKA